MASDRQWLFLSLALTLLGSFMGWSLYTEFQTIDLQEREHLTAQAKVVDENLDQQLTATNNALNSVRKDLPILKAQKEGIALLNHLQSIRGAMPSTRAITIFDANGTLIARSPNQFVGQNYSNREYFQSARQGGNQDTLYVAPPFLAATGEYVLNLSKVLLDDHGMFSGVILVSLGPEYFRTLLKSVLYSPDMRTSLIHGDGKVIFRIPDPQEITGIDLTTKAGAFFTQHMQSGRITSVFEGKVASTGEMRLSVLNTLHPKTVAMDKPLVIVVSRENEAIFASWREKLIVHSGMFLLLSMVAALGLYSFQQRRKEYHLLLASQEADRKQTEAELRIAAAAFESQEAMMITDGSNVILRVNRAFTQATGYTADEAVGQTPRILKSDRHSPEFYREMWESIKRTGGWQGEIWDRRKNGEVYPKWLTISAVKDAQGQVTHYIGTQLDITERKKAEDRIKELAFFDQLTNLPNRILLLDRLKQALAASSRSDTYGALLFIDLDNFKTLNDTQGHDVGDLLLKLVAQRLKLCVREGDTVARLGGDEFVVILVGLSNSEVDAANSIEAVAGKILASLGKPYQLSDAVYLCTASIGIALFKDDVGSTEDLMKQADLAMYKAKEAGRNAMRFFDPHMESVVKERAELEDDLRQGLEEGQFLLHYQAQVVGDGRLTGAEVLVRWLHPQRGMVSPADFIPLAEESGFILPLGHWILETACRQLAQWASQPEMAHLTLAVNVSARQFHQANFVEQVLAILTTTRANPERLKLELTESMLVENVQEIIEKMHAMKAKGVSFSLDDFGTGYSSLTYLKRLPIDQLKIDQSFVRDVLSDSNDAAIAQTVVALAQSLGLSVIAEGVETEAQWEFLAKSSCHAYQGYLFSKPLPIDSFEKFAQRT